MKQIQYIVVLLCSLLLVGCGGSLGNIQRNDPIVNHKTVHVIIAPSADLMLPTKKTPPPPRKAYQELDENNIEHWRIKEAYLSEAYIKQSGQVDQCNIDKKAISTFITKAKEQYKEEKE